MMRKIEVSGPDLSCSREYPSAIHINLTFGAPRGACRTKGASRRPSYSEPETHEEIKRRRESFEKRLMPFIQPYLNRPIVWDELGNAGGLMAMISVAYTLALVMGETEHRDKASEIISRILAAPDEERDPYWLTDASYDDGRACSEILDWFAPTGWCFGFHGDDPNLGYWPL